MSRPNHFVRPVQSDRLLHHYGNTRLAEPINVRRELVGGAFCIALVGLFLFGLGVAF